MFFGNEKTGVYSPSVQYTMHKMGVNALKNIDVIEAITLNMPNIHFIPMHNPKLGIHFNDDVFIATSEPHGTIEATRTRNDIDKVESRKALERHPAFPYARL